MPIALFSVHDKTGLIELAESLAGAGWTLLASGGTAATLRSAGLAPVDVAEWTGSPEILGGRVKTLHPAIHGGILSRGTEQDREELASYGWNEIDAVVCNLYPFEATVSKPGASEEECIEQIDIGGVTLLRAAAKNWHRVTVLCDPADYAEAADTLVSFRQATENSAGQTGTAGLRRRLAIRAFEVCTSYDASISSWMTGNLSLPLLPGQATHLRYGENPHQTASLFQPYPSGVDAYDSSATRDRADASRATVLGGSLLQGKEVSYNNILDLDAAWRALSLFSGSTAVVVKHVSPCGIAEMADSAPSAIARAVREAIASDPVSAFGGIIAINKEFNGQCVEALGELFVECIAAPSFSDEALSLLGARKNLRLLSMGQNGVERARKDTLEHRSVLGGMLVQEIDHVSENPEDWHSVTRRKPDEEESAVLAFAWKACAAVRSNAIVLAHSVPGGHATSGIGGGQPNRVDSTMIAVKRAGDRARGSVLASDAFFPFPDSVEVAAEAGITAIIQPGGSIRDRQSIEAADKAGLAMVATGHRHFRH